MKKFLWGIITVCLILITLAIGAGTTLNGLRALLWVANTFTPLSIETHQLNGFLFGEIEASEIVIRTSKDHWVIEKPMLRFNPLSLLESRVTVYSFDADSITRKRIHNSNDSIPSRRNHKTTRQLPKFEINNLKIQRLDIDVEKPLEHLHADNIQLSALNRTNKLIIKGSLSNLNHHLHSLSFHITGSPDKYQGYIRLSSQNKHWLAKCHGSHDHILLNSIHQKNTSGLFGTLSLNWSHGLQWKTKLTIKDLDMRPFLSHSPVFEHGQLVSEGEIHDQGFRANWTLSLATNQGRLTSKGNIGMGNDTITWSLNHLNLSEFGVAIKGTLTSNGRWSKDQAQGELLLDNLQWKDVRSQHIRLNASINTQTKHINTLSIQTQSSQIRGFSIDSIAFSTQQTQNSDTSSFTLNLSDRHPTSRVKKAHFSGLFTLNNRESLIRFLTGKITTRSGQWSLDKPANASLNWPDVSLSNWCFRNKHYRLCLSAFQKYDFRQLALNGTIPASELTISNPAYSKKPHLDIQIKSKLKQHGNHAITGMLSIHVPNTGQLILGSDSKIRLNPSNLLFKLNKNNVHVVGAIHWNRSSHLTIDTTVHHPLLLDSGWSNTKLNGRIRFDIDDMNDFNLWPQSVDIQSGHLVGQSIISGTIKDPFAKTKVDLSKTKIKVIPASLFIQSLNGEMTMRKQAMHYKLTGETGTGTFTIKGTTLPFKNWDTHLHFLGKKTILSQRRDIRAVGSPDLDIHIHDQTVDINGLATITQATIQPGAFSTGVTLSDDVHVIGKKKRKDWRVTLSVNVDLGGNTKVLDPLVHASIIGKLSVQKKLNRPYLGTGTLLVKDGRVDAYDLNLSISPKSQIIYNSTPIDSPSLNIDIRRKINAGRFLSQWSSGVSNLSVGLKAQGPYNRINVTLYSIPATLSQSDILSYLLFGHGSNSSSNFNLASMLGVLSSFSSGSLNDNLKKLMRIQKSLGFTELGMQSTVSLDALGTPYAQDQSGFVIGRYLNPKIYIRYTRGISSLLNLFQLQYLINKNWSIQVQSGSTNTSDANGLDLLYHFTSES